VPPRFFRAITQEKRMAENNQQGKHPHKSGDEAHSKNEQSGSKSGASSQKSGGGSQKGSSNDDLKSREYKDSQGNVHHHTHTAKEQGGKE
jgi:hypothetical protein